MHDEILRKEQKELLPLIKQFADEYYLVGGTVIALHIGHRRSIDFDLFTDKDVQRKKIRNVIEKSGFEIEHLLYEAYDQMHLLVNSVKLTFFNFPHSIPHPNDFNGIVSIPALLDLAAMKTHALGGRAKWKDYVDLYYILKDHYDLKAVSKKAREIFGTLFNEKLFREQLCYFDDIDYSEKIEFIQETIPDETIKEFLSEVATSEFD